jgi:hypothetical protein
VTVNVRSQRTNRRERLAHAGVPFVIMASQVSREADTAEDVGCIQPGLGGKHGGRTCC